MSIDLAPVRRLPARAAPVARSALARAALVCLALAAAGLPACRASDPAVAPRAPEPVCDTPGLPAGAPTLLADVRLPVLDDASLAAWADHLAPTPDELSWEVVDWLPTYAEGVAASLAQRRPLLLWAMNGHPLGCT